LEQTFKDLEVVIVNDGSTDNTAQIIGPYLNNPRVQYLREDHVGHPAAKNIGIKNCQAPLIAFLDADDIWLPSKIEKQIALFEQNPNLGVAFTKREFIDEQGQKFDRQDYTLYRGKVIEQLFLNNFVCFSSSMVSRKAFDEHGILDESIPDNCDYELWLRIARTFPFDFVDDQLVKYRTGHANLTQQGAGNSDRLLMAIQIMDRFLETNHSKNLISPEITRQGYAETYCHIGQRCQNISRLQALSYYFKSLSYRPFQTETWFSLAKWLVPRKLQPQLKKLYFSLIPSRRGSCQAS
jgi:glycosyltransferase involved in cell wall biosynthesis